MNLKLHKIIDWIGCYLVPRFVWKLWWYLRHPHSTYHRYKHYRWAKNIKPGDVVCTCGCKHAVVKEVDEWLGIIDTDGIAHDLLDCCEPVKANGSCHNSYRLEDEE